MLDRVCIGAGSVVVSVLSIDTSGGGSGFADGLIGTVDSKSVYCVVLQYTFPYTEFEQSNYTPRCS